MPERFIPYSRQQIDEDDIAAVVDVLRSDWLTQGPAIEAFENAMGAYCSAPHAVAVSSATAGLHVACAALGVGPGDIVWTSPLSFVASANCARYLGANVDFVDIDPVTGLMSQAALAEKLAAAKKTGTLPKAVIPVHYAGRACDIAAMAALAGEYGFSIIEDAAHALGASYTDGCKVGDGSHSDATVFSFHAVKPITTGEGGMVMTRHPALAQRMKLYRTHGVTRDPALLQKTDKPEWYYEQQSLGYHYRLTDIQAALGLSQLKKLERYIASRRALAQRYREKLGGLKLRLPPADPLCGWHLYVVQMEAKRRDDVFEALREKQIGVNLHYWPIHLQPYYQSLGFTMGQFPQAEAFADTALSLPLHPALTHGEQDDVITTLAACLA